jgi:hypothetical protein
MKYVKHVKFPEWGVGTILTEPDASGKVDVVFKRGSVRFPLLELEEIQKLDICDIRNSGQRTQSEVMLEKLLSIKFIDEAPTRTEWMQFGFGNPNAVAMALRNRGYDIETIVIPGNTCKYFIRNIEKNCGGSLIESA